MAGMSRYGQSRAPVPLYIGDYVFHVVRRVEPSHAVMQVFGNGERFLRPAVA